MNIKKLMSILIFLIPVSCKGQTTSFYDSAFLKHITSMTATSTSNPPYTISAFPKPKTFEIHFYNFGDSIYTIGIQNEDMGKVAQLLSDFLCTNGIENAFKKNKAK